ncbi:filamentous hemagglutinin N-terminal domain-containing protein [Nostoc sp. UIC 10607]|uniref:two-partner secretion domain-containing protein n=1 Tax=Nostoc sp. UIC 10607 TaxID=3045935 RepID=UPI0039A2404B
MKLNHKTKLKIKWQTRISWIFKVSALYCLSFSSPIAAQIVPDSTLPNNSRVTTQDSTNTIKINGGTKAGNNLFHSFKEFSVPTHTTAFFDNTLNLQNIISRVTGKSVSNIDGLIRTNGAANLFLINPNGIIFGSNARLNVGGSFLASTASTVKFPNNLEFSATNPQPSSLLSINTPLGLQYGKNPSAIQALGDGQGTRRTSELIDTANALRVQSNQTLALVGGDMSLEGATLKTTGGRIELGSVIEESLVRLIPIDKGFALNYDAAAQNLGKIELSQQATVDASGEGSGDIQIRARQITIRDGSQIEASALGVKPGGKMEVSATNSIELSGTSANGRVRSGIASTVYPGVKGSSGNLILETRQLNVREGALLGAFTFGAGRGGDLIIKASDSTEVTGFSSINPRTISTISTVTSGTGNGGNFILSTGKLTIKDGATLGVAIFGVGQGGDVTVNATNSIEVTGVSSRFSPSSLSNTTFSIGNAGNLKIDTPKLIIMDGGSVNTSTLGTGNAGNLFVNASDYIKISGEVQRSESPIVSNLSSSGVITTSPIQQVFNVSPLASGDSGEIRVNTKTINIANGGIFSIRNDGLGDAKSLQINVESISLNNRGRITASTASGEGGNIVTNARIIHLQDHSTITTTAGNNGNGGNININTNILIVQRNSHISANAFGGRGGNIQINARDGFFFSRDSGADASSQFGVNGTVQINGNSIDSMSIKALPGIIQETPTFASACEGGSGAVASFVKTGTGGIPRSPNDMLSSKSVWHDNSVSVQDRNSEQPKLSTKQTTQIVEAQALVIDSKGNFVLTAEVNSPTPYVVSSSNLCS